METSEKQSKNGNLERAQADCPPATFTKWDQLWLLLSIVAYIFNKIIDVVLIHTYLSSGDLAWGLLTVLIVAVPQAVVHVISYRWHVHDQEASTSVLVIHCCQLGLFLRLVAQFSDGRRWRRSKSHDDAMVYLQQSSDISLLQLFLSYLESAPQLLLQVYVTSTQDGWQLVQAVSAVLSLLSLAWSNASYAKWMRQSRGDKLPLGWTAAILQLLWRLCFLLARVSALLCLSLLLGGWVLLLLTAHWLLMTGWVLTQRTDLFPTVWEERLFNAVVGGIYCFSFFNVKETPARWRMLAFYTLVFTENITMATVFFFYWPRPSDDLYTVVLANVAAGTALGTLVMLLYYRRFHPNVSGRPSASCCASPLVAAPREAALDSEGGAADLQPGDGGTLRSLKCRAAKRVSVTSLRSAGGISLASQPDPVTSHEPAVTSPPARTSSPAAARDKPFHSASELLNAAAAAASGHVTRSAASLPAGGGHVTAAERRNQSAAAILQSTAVSAEADSVLSGAGRVSDIPQLDTVSEGDITLTPAGPASEPARPSSSDDGGGDSTAANHSRMTSGASAPPPDYENLIAVNVHRADLGVRAWRTYSDVGDGAHDYSVVTDRAGRLDDSSVTLDTDGGGGGGGGGGRHTYENTDNVALMIAHLEDGEAEAAAEVDERGTVRAKAAVKTGRVVEAREEAEGEGREAPRDASLLVTTIDAVERSGVSALFSSPPRRSRSTDDLAAEATVAARRRLLNTSFDPAVLVAPPSGDRADYKCPRSPPEAIYARPAKRGGSGRGESVRGVRRGKVEVQRGSSGQRGFDGGLNRVAMESNRHKSESYVIKTHQITSVAPTQITQQSSQRMPPKVHPVPQNVQRARHDSQRLPAESPRSPLAAANTPSAASPRRKFSVLRSRFEPAGRRYAVTPAAGGTVSRRPSLQEAARALWTGRARRHGKENTPPQPPPPPPPAMSPIDL